MFARVIALLPLALLVSASHLEARNDCGNNNSLQCCNSVQTVQQAQPFLQANSLLSVVAGVAADVLLGIECSPITVVGTSTGASCTQQTACCDNNQMNGLVNIACTPINVNA